MLPDVVLNSLIVPVMEKYEQRTMLKLSTRGVELKKFHVFMTSTPDRLEELVVSRFGPLTVSSYCPIIHLERLKEITKNFSQISL
jgi:hypothetical protein